MFFVFDLFIVDIAKIHVISCYPPRSGNHKVQFSSPASTPSKTLHSRIPFQPHWARIATAGQSCTNSKLAVCTAPETSSPMDCHQLHRWTPRGLTEGRQTLSRWIPWQSWRWCMLMTKSCLFVRSLLALAYEKIVEWGVGGGEIQISMLAKLFFSCHVVRRTCPIWDVHLSRALLGLQRISRRIPGLFRRLASLCQCSRRLFVWLI